MISINTSDQFGTAASTDYDVFYFWFWRVMGLSQEGPVVIVVDVNNHRLVMWRLGDGIVWKQFGSEGMEPGQFSYPQAVAVTRTGALVVTDRNRVQVLTVDGAVLCVLDPTAVAGVGQLGLGLSGVTVCAGTDETLVTDFSNHRMVALMWLPASQVPHFCFKFTFSSLVSFNFVLCDI